MSWPSLSHSSSAVCGANGDSRRTSASIASRTTQIVSRRSATPTRATSSSARRPGAPVAVRSLNAYSSLTSSIIADTAVLSCWRSSMSAVTRRIVSCVLRRRARSAAFSDSQASGLIDPFPADRLAPVVEQPPDAREEAEATLEARIGPLDLLLRRRDEHAHRAAARRRRTSAASRRDRRRCPSTST